MTQVDREELLMFGHPLHPIAVHFPVVLLVGGELVYGQGVGTIAGR